MNPTVDRRRQARDTDDRRQRPRDPGEGALTRGRIVSLAILIVLSWFAPGWMSQPQPHEPALPSELLQSLRELKFKRASEEKKAQALERVLRDAGRRKDALSSEQLQMLAELKAARAEDERRKITLRLVNSVEIAEAKTLSFAEWAADSWVWAQDTYRLHRDRAQWSLWLIAALLAGGSFAGILLSLPHFARVFARLGFRISRGWLVVLSFVAIALVLVTRTNPWAGFPMELLLAPIVALVGCGLALRIIDISYPVWNSIVRGCGAPLMSMAFAAVYLRLI